MNPTDLSGKITIPLVPHIHTRNRTTFSSLHKGAKRGAVTLQSSYISLVRKIRFPIARGISIEPFNIDTRVYKGDRNIMGNFNSTRSGVSGKLKIKQIEDKKDIKYNGPWISLSVDVQKNVFSLAILYCVG